MKKTTIKFLFLFFIFALPILPQPTSSYQHPVSSIQYSGKQYPASGILYPTKWQADSSIQRTELTGEVERSETKTDYRNRINIPEYNPSLMPLKTVRTVTGVWTELNPKVPRVTYFGLHFINKDTGIVVGNFGAIIKTTDGGQSWKTISTNTNKLLLKVHSFNGRTVIVTGYNGTILRSTDSGDTFTPLTSTTSSDLWGVKMLNDTLGFICGLNKTLLKTTNAGESWQSINAGLSAHYWAIDFINEKYGMIACASGKVLKTTDGGNSWQQIQAGDGNDLYTIDIIDSLHIAAAGLNGKNIYSSDGGVSWIQNNRLQHDEINSIKFIHTDTGYIIGSWQGSSWGIRKTTNRGINWFQPQIGNLSEWELELLPNGIGYSCGSDLWINKTIGGYDNWQGLFLNANFVDVYFTDELTGYAADGRWTGGPLYKTTNGGLNWFSLPNFPSNLFTSSLRCITFTDQVTGYSGGFPCKIVKTTDAGNSWHSVNLAGLTDTNGFINKIFFISSTTGWAVTSRGAILKTTDGGENWFAQITLPADSYTSIYFIDSLNGWATSRYIWQTTNGGQNWIQRTDIPVFMGTDIYFINNNGYAIQLLKLFRTSDNGQNWIEQINSQFIIRTFGWLSSNHGFIIGDAIYESNDTGNNWYEILGLRNVGLRKFHAPRNYIGYSIGYSGLIYKYLDTMIIPVELISFAAVVQNNNIILKWATATESNNYGFEIYRSNDLTNWEKIGFVEGKGISSFISEYKFIDNVEISGKYYYKLKQIDFDGSFNFTNHIEANISVPTNFKLSQNFPNPFNPVTKIIFEVPIQSKVKIILHDILGKEIIVLINGSYDAGYHSLNLNASDLSSGIYFYCMTTDKGYTATKKLTIIK